MSLTRIGSVAFAMLWLCMAMSAVAFEGPVQKKVFTLATYTTGSGKTIKNVRVGYETYGTLNAAGDNAIFIPHFFTGNSHAAGKYTPTDPAAGYWDPIIGAGKPIDTDKFFVISADALANLSTKDPNVTTTGPATIKNVCSPLPINSMLRTPRPPSVRTQSGRRPIRVPKRI